MGVCLTLVTLGARERPRTRVRYAAALVLCVGATGARMRPCYANTPHGFVSTIGAKAQACCRR
ncbi:hypothetical protein KDH_69420 [Dictyobacter sp. S3.2.2.5]|uniref:Uncharacterized protein n=1 Tax=Dictyobacter halimunensis TaxID=3026934 RepID=A0ABQ6G2R8_9CHLR|nr:hypothetical protein KDH_69420 [Dictyobacter sp. S3.2.2.5]